MSVRVLALRVPGPDPAGDAARARALGLDGFVVDREDIAELEAVRADDFHLVPLDGASLEPDPAAWPGGAPLGEPHGLDLLAAALGVRPAAPRRHDGIRCIAVRGAEGAGLHPRVFPGFADGTVALTAIPPALYVSSLEKAMCRATAGLVVIDSWNDTARGTAIVGDDARLRATAEGVQRGRHALASGLWQVPKTDPARTARIALLAAAIARIAAA